MAIPSPEPRRPRVLAMVVARKGDDLGGVLQSIEAQVYEVEDVVVVTRHGVTLKTGEGSDGSPPKRATSLSGALRLVETPVEYLWMLDSRTTARPDALASLVETAEQVEASVAGSKVLDADHPDQLLSVGGATDVFGFPFTGLDRGEIDQEQFDVIRDVAYLEPASLLVRRDLAEGLGGLDHALPYISTGLDLCQRARVVGGRVVVAPASEVFNRAFEEGRLNTWREQAGRLRVMIKTYSPVTLLWTIPGLLLVGLLSSLHRAVTGSPSAPLDWLRTWAWNALHLPSTIMARRRAPAVSMDSDSEIFRFQIKGSVELRALAADLGAVLGSGDEQEEEEKDPEAPPAFWQRPDVIATVLGVAFVLVATRSILTEGLPSTGFVLPLAESAWNTLRAYAGGWHLGGLGSPEPMHPSVGASAAVQMLLGDRGPLAATLLTVGSVASGLAGMVALLRRQGLGRGARLAAGAVFVAGFPVLALAGEGYWPVLPALGGLPWALAAVVSPSPDSFQGWVGRLARIGLATAWSALFMPLSILLPLLFGLLWALVARHRVSAITGPAGSILALPVLLPWLLARDPAALLGAGLPFHLDPAWWAFIPLAVAALAAALSGWGRPLTVTVAGLVIGSIGFLAARASGLGFGLEPTAAGFLAVALGTALVVGGAFDGPSTLAESRGVRKLAGYTGMVAAIVVGLSTLVAVPAGRMGLPDDRFEKLAFTDTRAGVHGPDRILLTGPGETLPGEYRRLPGGAAYRLIGGNLDYPQAWLPEPLEGDAALEQTLMALLTGQELRPGSRLAEYGIRWVVVTGPSPLVEAMNAQLDLRPLGGLYIGEDGGVWENEARAYRAVTDVGVPWSWVGPDYTGRSLGESVLINENADPRWGPGEWQAAGWANRVSADSGTASFEGVSSYRRQARLAGLAFVVLAALALVRRPPAPDPEEAPE